MNPLYLNHTGMAPRTVIINVATSKCGWLRYDWSSLVPPPPRPVEGATPPPASETTPPACDTLVNETTFVTRTTTSESHGNFPHREASRSLRVRESDSNRIPNYLLRAATECMLQT